MKTLDQSLESLSVCHLQDEPLWPAARVVAQQDIDEFVRQAGREPTDKRQALIDLMAAFKDKFPAEFDPVLIRSYMRSQLRRIGYDLKHEGEHNETAVVMSRVSDTLAAASEPDSDLDEKNSN